MRYPSTVVIVLRKRNNDWDILFLKKTGRNLWHANEVCFPGGRMEEGEDPIEAALREFEEEVGVDRSHIKVVASIDKVETVSTPFVIYPFVAVTVRDFEPRVDGVEIEEAFWVPLSEILKLYPFKEETYCYKGMVYKTYLIPLEGRIIWGATARILSNFIATKENLPLDKDQ